MESNELDDSVCILYESIRPPPEIEVVREIVVLTSEENLPNIEENTQQAVVDICEDSSDSVTERDSSSNIAECIEKDDSITILQDQNRLQSKIAHDLAGTDSSNSRKNKKSKVQCGICFDGLEEISASHRTLGSTICGHIFCDACMALSRSNSTQCPTCRKRLGKNQFHPIYLNL